MGGDEFLLVLPRVESRSTVEAIVRRIRDTVSEPFRVRGVDVAIGCCLGAALAMPARVTSQELLAASDEAAYRAKRSGKNQFAITEIARDPSNRRA